MRQLALTLFGAFAAGLGAQSLRLPTDKTRALLAYLALTPDTPLRREMLAGLLWPEQPDAMARQNLRKTAGRLRQALEDLDPKLAGDLLFLTKQTITLQAAYCAVDVVAFRGHLEAARKHPHASLAQCPACLASLETAAGLYRQGELLAALSLPDAAPFAEWLLMQRESLARQQLAALDQLASTYEQQGGVEKARQYALWQIQQEPWRETAHRQLMRLLAAQGQRAEAIAQYQACRRILQAELGVEPAAETEALLTQIMDGSLPLAATRQAAARSRPWPRLPSPLIGREAEMAEIIARLADPACRVLSVIGPGGIGKTSLALAVGEQLSRDPPPWLAEGVYFVPLAEIANASLLPAAISEAIGLALSQRQGVAAQVEQFLRPKALVLILDNFEQLLPEAAWLHNLLAASSYLKLVVTSREPLNWQAEWRYPLAGLAYPLGEAEGEDFEAVRLFVQAARQVQPGFAYTAENGRSIARICQLVYGWPLALQMAAGWVRMLTCQAIADQIGAGLDLLTTSLRDVAPRQRSLRVVFEHTWAALSGEERRLLEQLAVFRGGFTLAAAREVAGASPHVLRGLVEKSLVQPDGPGSRFRLHELLRQFAIDNAQADPDALTLAEQRHGRYYLRLLEAQGQRLSTTEFQAALEALKADSDNVRQAWLWAAGGGQHALLAGSLGHMAKYHESSGLPQEAVAFFQRTISVLTASGAERPTGLMARVLYHQADSLLTMGQYDQATTAVLAAQEIAQAVGDGTLTNLLFMTQAKIFLEQGRYEQAHAVLREAIAFSQAHNDRRGVALALHTQGNTYWYMAAYEQAQRCYEEGREIYRQLGPELAVSVLTGNIGAVQWRLGQYQAALANYEVALQAHRRVGNASRVAIWLGNIGLVYADLHDDERALAHLDEAVAMHDQLGRKYYKVDLLLGKVAVFLRRGEVETAIVLHRQATELATLIGNRTYLLDCDLWQARLYAAQGCPADAAQLLQSLQAREFRPDVTAAIARELARLTF